MKKNIKFGVCDIDNTLIVPHASLSKPAKKIIKQLCDIVSKNGNLLLNIGPQADGSFHPDAKKQLYAVGD